MRMLRCCIVFLTILGGSWNAVAGDYHKIGYYLPDGQYVRTYHCWYYFLGYNWRGQRVYRRVCGWR